MEDLRTKSRLVRFTVYLLFGLLILSFGLWGIGDYVTGSSAPDEIAEVDGTPVPLSEFENRLRLEARQLQQRTREPVTQEMLISSGIAQRSLRILIQRTLLDRLASDLGLAVSPALVAERIAQQPQFQDARERFDQNRYFSTLRTMGIRPEVYEAEVQADMARQFIQAAVVFGAEMPEVGSKRLFEWREQRRTLSYATLPAPDPAGLEAPDDATLQDLYEERKGRFRAPEYRQVTLLHISPDGFLDAAEIPPEELAEAVEAEQESHGTPEMRSWRQIIFDDEATANAAKAEVEAGSSLAEASEKHGGTAPSILALQPQSRVESILPQLADAVFAETGEGDLVVAQTPLGWHLIEITEVVAPEAAAPEQVEASVRQDLRMEKAVDAMVAFANEVDAELATGATLDEAANALGLELRTLPAIDNRGRDRQGQPVAGLPEPDDFLPMVFDSDVGIESLLQEAGDGSFYAFRVDEVMPAADKPFADVRDQVLEVWRREEARRQVVEKAEALAQQINDGSLTLAEAARQQGQPVITAPPMSRTDTPQQLRGMPDLVRAAFRAEPETAFAAQVPAGAALASVVALEEKAPSEDQEAFDTLQNALDQDVRADLWNGFVTSLESRYPVRYNGEALDRALSQF